MSTGKVTTPLLPCPFCGEKPTVSMTDTQWQICCDIVNCPAYPSVIENQLADAERKWNTRNEPTNKEGDTL